LPVTSFIEVAHLISIDVVLHRDGMPGHSSTLRRWKIRRLGSYFPWNTQSHLLNATIVSKCLPV